MRSLQQYANDYEFYYVGRLMGDVFPSHRYGQDCLVGFLGSISLAFSPEQGHLLHLPEFKIDMVQKISDPEMTQIGLQS